MIFLAVLAIIGNSGVTAFFNIQREMVIVSCPTPIYEGYIANVTLTDFTINYNTLHDLDINGAPTSNPEQKAGSYLRCERQEPSGFNISTEYKEYGATLFSAIPYGGVAYASDYIGVIGQKISSIFTMIYFFLTPANFNILGYTINDLSGIALMFIVIVYSVCYIFIGAMAWKIISPFSGVG